VFYFSQDFLKHFFSKRLMQHTTRKTLEQRKSKHTLADERRATNAKFQLGGAKAQVVHSHKMLLVAQFNRGWKAIF